MTTIPVVVVDAGNHALLAVRVEGGHSNRELAEAIATHLERSPTALWSLTRETFLDPDAPALASGLRAGELLTFEPPEEIRRRGRSTVAVTGGPAAGTHAPLGDEVVIGRSTEVDLRLPDEALSRRHLRIRREAGRVTTTDLGSSNGTYLDGAPVPADAEVEVAPGSVIEAGDSLIEVRHDDVALHPTDGSGTVPFNRPPRVRVASPPGPVTIPAPPEEPGRSRLPIAAALGPMLMGGAMVVLGGGATMVMGLAMGALGVVMAVVSHLESRKGSRAADRDAGAKFDSAVDAAARQLAAARRSEVERLRDLHPDIALLADWARARAPELWRRRRGDPDFLHVRIGHADLPYPAEVTIDSGGSAARREAALERLRPVQVLPAAPVAVDLAGNPVVGLAGSATSVEAAGRAALLHLAGNHSPAEVALVALLSPSTAEGWWWLPLLPHLHSSEIRLQPERIATSAAEAEPLLDALADLVEARRPERGSSTSAAPHVLVVVDERLALSRDRLRPLLQAGPQVALSVLWLGSDPRELPGECSAILRPPARGDGPAELVYPSTADVVTGVVLDHWSDASTARLAATLAPLRDVGGSGAAGSIPSVVPLRQMLDAELITPELLESRWEQEPGDLVAAVGVDTDGPVQLALRRDGPHALVGGTTGSGKSELLQAWVAVLAASYTPARLNFLLVDYKGGAAFRECVELPHVVGMVTDLDPHLMARVVRSLRAELDHRMRVLDAADVSNISDLERVAPGRLPSLMIVVDEFAQLAKDLPTFVDKVVEIAAIGRSLGVHLVLATQRPAESIGASIQANTNLRLALRTAKAEESNNIINGPEAAFIDRATPGRCFVKVGEGRARQFQSAFAGAPALAESSRTAGGDPGPLAVAPYSRGVPRFPKGTAPATERSELEAVVDAAATAWRQRDGATPRVPWLPPLPARLPHDEIPTSGDGERFAIPVGMIDLPDTQEQRPWVLELGTAGSALVYGTTGSGKTVLLRTVATQAARLLDPTRLQIQAIDFGARGLAGLDVLPHCGTVVPGDNKALVQRMVRHLVAEADRRTKELERSGTTSIAEHNRTAPERPMPRLLVLVDGIATMATAFERVDMGESIDNLNRLVTEGRSIGMHFLLTSNRRTGTPMAQSVSLRIVLRMADADDYAALGLLDGRDIAAADLPAGRGFVDGYEVQSALVGTDPAGDAQRVAIAALAAALPRSGAEDVPVIRLLPPSVPLDALPAPEQQWLVPLGEEDESHLPLWVDLSHSHFVVAGPYRSGRTTALCTLATGLVATGTRVVVLCPRRSALSEVAGVEAHVGDDAVIAAVSVLGQEVAERAPGALPLAVLLDDGEAFVESYDFDGFTQVVKAGRTNGVRVIAAAEITAASRAFSGWMPELRKDQYGLLLQPDVETDGNLLAAGLPRRLLGDYPPGRGFVAERGTVRLVQVASGDTPPTRAVASDRTRRGTH